MDKKNVMVGDRVLYVLKSHELRSLTVTRISSDRNSVNGILSFDGPRDASQLETEIPLTRDQLSAGTAWVDDIPYNETGAGKTLVPGSWHFPEARAQGASG